MLTPFGKCLRMMRMDHGELMKDMADTLGVTPAYLSAVENGKKQPTKELVNRLQSSYNLDEEYLNKIEEARAYTTNTIMLDFDNETDGELSIMFARRLSSLSSGQKSRIANILQNKKGGA